MEEMRAGKATNEHPTTLG